MQACTNGHTHGNTVTSVRGCAIECPAILTRTFQESRTHCGAIFIATSAEHYSFASTYKEFLTFVLCNSTNNFTLSILEKFVSRSFPDNSNLVALLFHTFSQAEPESFTRASFSLWLLVGDLIEVFHALRIRSTVGVIARVLCTRKVGEGGFIKARLTTTDKFRVEALHEFQVTGAQISPKLCKAIRVFWNFTFFFPRNIFPREHGFCISLKGLRISIFERAVENTTRHTRIRNVSVFRIFFKNDDTSTVLCSNDCSGCASTTEA